MLPLPRQRAIYVELDTGRDTYTVRLKRARGGRFNRATYTTSPRVVETVGEVDDVYAEDLVTTIDGLLERRA